MRRPWTRSSTATAPTVPARPSATGTRSAHEANLYDIEAKYGDVVDLHEVLTVVSGFAATEDPERDAFHAAGSGRAREP